MEEDSSILRLNSFFTSFCIYFPIIPPVLNVARKKSLLLFKFSILYLLTPG